MAPVFTQRSKLSDHTSRIGRLSIRRKNELESNRLARTANFTMLERNFDIVKVGRTLWFKCWQHDLLRRPCQQNREEEDQNPKP